MSEPPLTSTVPLVLDTFLDLINAAEFAPKAFESWPGPDGAPEMFVLGQIDWESYVIPTMKAGRVMRQEEWSIEFELYVVGAEGTTAANARPARTRAFQLLAPIENLLADDPSAGTTYLNVQSVQLRPTEAGPRQFEKGWAYRMKGFVDVKARLL